MCSCYQRPDGGHIRPRLRQGLAEVSGARVIELLRFLAKLHTALARRRARILPLLVSLTDPLKRTADVLNTEDLLDRVMEIAWFSRKHSAELVVGQERTVLFVGLMTAEVAHTDMKNNSLNSIHV